MTSRPTIWRAPLRHSTTPLSPPRAVSASLLARRRARRSAEGDPSGSSFERRHARLEIIFFAPSSRKQFRRGDERDDCGARARTTVDGAFDSLGKDRGRKGRELGGRAERHRGCAPSLALIWKLARDGYGPRKIYARVRSTWKGREQS